MKPVPFKYHDPRSIPELTALLGKYEQAKLLAGGQSLGPMLNYRYVVPDHLIDLNRIPELAYIRDGDHQLEVGAMTRQRTLERSEEVRRVCPILVEALGWVGHFQTRNRGTIGGSLAHLDPAAELPGVCALYDATLGVVGPRGERTISMGDWGAGFMTPSLDPDEALAKLTLHLWREPHGHAFLEFSRRRGDFAIAAIGCLLMLDGAKVRRVALAVMGVSQVPTRLTAAERLLTGADLSDESLAAAANEIGALEALDDAHTSGLYRKRVAGVLLVRALRQAATRARAMAAA
jgi:Aerobic-type carbon monoxide dehydrogenase, middle subunit CoxM/CutM homologs